MNNLIKISLTITEQQFEQLRQLQLVFSYACNELFPIVRETACWNRVGLHHLAYKRIREKFPELGAQMASNAIYSVSRICREVLQNPRSPFFFNKKNKIPNIRFGRDCPVFFDRHTLSLKSGVLSMYTLDGRIKFKIDLCPKQEEKFQKEKLKEITLTLDGGRYALIFSFDGVTDVFRKLESVNDGSLEEIADTVYLFAA